MFLLFYLFPFSITSDVLSCQYFNARVVYNTALSVFIRFMFEEN